MEPIRITTPMTKDVVDKLKSGDTVLITGTVYAARDAAHKKLVDALDRGEALPFDPKDQIIYYVGPSPAKPGRVIGSAGPTTSYRMDPYAPRMIAEGQTGMIGKGLRDPEVVDAMKQYGAVYFAAIGGAGALMAQRIKSAEVIAFPELGPEALRKLYVEDFPATVVIDRHGVDLYKEGKAKYRRIG